MNQRIYVLSRCGPDPNRVVLTFYSEEDRAYKRGAFEAMSELTDPRDAKSLVEAAAFYKRGLYKDAVRVYNEAKGLDQGPGFFVYEEELDKDVPGPVNFGTEN